MRAIVFDTYGSPDVLQLKDVDKPIPKGNEVLVRVRAASANPLDWHKVRGEPYIMRAGSGLRRPKETVLGNDMAGEVEAVGEDVTSFRPGDQVMAGADSGTFAEYSCVSEDVAALKPTNLSFQQAAGIPVAGLTALQGLRDHGRLQPGQKVLIIGASGGVGTFAVQIAKAFGADVTGVCSTRNVELVRSLGADDVIDYMHEDFTRTGRHYDVIFQLAGTLSPAECRRALTPRGTLVLSSGESGGRGIGPLDRMLKAAVLSPFVKQRLTPFLSKGSKEDLEMLKGLIEAGKVVPVIDKTYSLSQVPEAIRYVEDGHTRGKVVITI